MIEEIEQKKFCLAVNGTCSQFDKQPYANLFQKVSQTTSADMVITVDRHNHYEVVELPTLRQMTARLQRIGRKVIQKSNGELIELPTKQELNRQILHMEINQFNKLHWCKK
jgi:hypothetical protein